MKKYAVIVAGGKGVRMGAAVPKQFLPLHGRPMLYYSIQAFLTAYPDIQLILVLPANMLSYAQIVLTSFTTAIDLTIVAGGETRYHSVQNGLKAIEGSGIVFIHDGARPLISVPLIEACYEQALQHGSAIPVIPVAESIRRIAGEHSTPVDRDSLRVIQTPQTFQTDVIIPAFQQSWQAAFTDEATVLEAFGGSVNLIPGERANIKVTTPEDMLIAEALMHW